MSILRGHFAVMQIVKLPMVESLVDDVFRRRVYADKPES